jgi:ABC-type oligopeptide transport system ATPase subunit
MNNEPAILEINRLKKYFPLTKGLLHKVVGIVKAVDDVTGVPNVSDRRF